MQEAHSAIFAVENIELTPNPRSVKFILNQTVIDSGSKTIEEGGYLEKDAFAHNLFALDIVDLVYLRENFVSVTLISADLWVIFKDKVKNIIEADLRKYEDGDEEVSASILDDFDKEKYPTDQEGIFFKQIPYEYGKGSINDIYIRKERFVTEEDWRLYAPKGVDDLEE